MMEIFNYYDLEKEELIERLEKIECWCNAYPVKVFRKPSKEDWKRVAKLLKENGFTLDCFSADCMRHVLEGIKGILKDGEK